MREIRHTQQAGQCENQIGGKFWELVCAEQLMLPDVTMVPQEFSSRGSMFITMKPVG